MKKVAIPDGGAGHGVYWCAVRSSADKRGYAFELTQDYVRAMCKSRCHYCGSEPSNTLTFGKNRDKVFKYNGIDRLDNSIGYTEDNCVPCCGRCNKMKGTMGCSEFIELVKKIAENFK